MDNPILVEVTRGPIAESWHRAAVVVALGSGERVLSLGDVERAVYPRSAAKPFQALALLATGDPLAAALSDEETAILCASHNGEPAHVETVAALLAKLGLGPDALECGPAWPLHIGAGRALAASGGVADTIHHPCSGKHAGMLALAKALGADRRGYVRRDHPVQTRIAAVLGEVLGRPLAEAPCGTDGCSVPTWAVPLAALAAGYARLATGEGLPADLARGAERVRAAMAAAPFMVAGSARFCTDAMATARGRAIVKTGAEGTMCAGLPGRGLGIAVKCDDGAARASEVVMAHCLAAFGAVDAGEPAMARLMTREVHNANGRHTGDIRASAALTRALAREAGTMLA